MQWSEGLSNIVCIIISRYIHHMEFSAFLFYHILLYSYDSNVYHFILGFMFMLNSVNCVLLLYCYEFLSLSLFRSVYFVSLCCSVYCLCVNVHCTAATCCQPNCS